MVISCGDPCIASAACEALELVEQNVKDTGRLFYRWWNFEVLAMKSLQAMAEKEAAEADMIIIGTHKGSELPQEITDWMGRWMALRKGRPGALALVLNSDPKKPNDSTGIVWQLGQRAAFSQMDFFAIQAAAVGMDAEATRSIREVIGKIRQNAVQGRTSQIFGLKEEVVENRHTGERLQSD